MDKQQALALFHEHDDPVRWESPEGFDREGANARFQDFAAAFDAAIGELHEIETGTYIQDASFHSQLAVGSSWVRFSNFGNLVCITPDHELDDATLDTLARLCREKGYLLVPTEHAEQDYDGDNPGVTGIRDWWIRFFDWV